MGGKCISSCLSGHPFSNFSCRLAFNNIASAMNRKHWILLKTKCCNLGEKKKKDNFFLYIHRNMLARKYPLCLAHGGGYDTISQTSAFAMWCKIILSTREKQSLQPCRFKDESCSLNYVSICFDFGDWNSILDKESWCQQLVKPVPIKEMCWL